MTGFNRTGPAGQGPLTGRGWGLCATDRTANEAPVYNNAGMGRGLGFGRGRGLGRGLRRGFGPANTGDFQTNREMLAQSNPQNLETEINRLQARAESMQRSLDAISERMAKMEKAK